MKTYPQEKLAAVNHFLQLMRLLEQHNFLSDTRIDLDLATNFPPTDIKSVDIIDKKIRITLSYPEHFPYTLRYFSWKKCHLTPSPYAFNQRPQNCNQLKMLISDFMHGKPVEITQFIFQWVPRFSPSLLGKAIVGNNATLGQAIFSAINKIQIKIGPLTWEEMRTLSQNTPPLLSLIQSHVDPFINSETILLFHPPATPTTLGGKETFLHLNSHLGRYSMNNKYVRLKSL